MKFIKLDYFFYFLILIISLLFVLELFLFSGRPATFDTTTHINTFTQFNHAIKSGDFPVVWLNDFANYGLPVGIFTHQFTNYLGALINLITQNPVLTYNILIFSAIFLSSIFFYSFLRLYFTPLASLFGIIIFSFTPYRIFNVYIRGAMPEIFSSIFLPLIFIFLYLFIVKRKIYAFFALILSIAGLTLCHPMMLIVYSFLFIPYLIFLLWNSSLSIKVKTKLFSLIVFAFFFGVALASFYVLPLNLEIKYFYYIFETDHLTGPFLSFSNYFGSHWDYFTKNEVFTRGHIAQLGLVETGILLFSFAYYIYKKLFNKNKENLRFLEFILISSLLIIFFTSSLAEIFLKNISILNNIQLPSRFLSSLIFLPPLLGAFFFDRFPKKIILLSIVILVSLLSFPQIYGKNFTVYPIDSYSFSKDNLYSLMMNTRWTGKSEDYPDKKTQGEIVEGQGKIIKQILKNSSRIYEVDATTSLKMIDRTFYFPGWNVYIDGARTSIEFQNPQYRGLITYAVPAGKHAVYLAFEDTKVRLAGKVLSLAFLTLFVVLLFLRKRIKKFLV